jgi:hypothetical protein
MMSRAEVPINPENDALIRQTAAVINRHGLRDPITVILQAGQPLAVVAAQLLLIFQPLLALFWPYQTIGQFATLLEDKRAIQAFIQYLETE